MGFHANVKALRRSQEELESEFDLIDAELSGGKTLTSWSVGDSSAEKHVWLAYPPDVRLEAVCLALHQKDPDNWPIDLVTKITQTRVVFNA